MGRIIVTVLSEKRWIVGNLFSRFTNLFRTKKKEPEIQP